MNSHQMRMVTIENGGAAVLRRTHPALTKCISNLWTAITRQGPVGPHGRRVEAYLVVGSGIDMGELIKCEEPEPSVEPSRSALLLIKYIGELLHASLDAKLIHLAVCTMNAVEALKEKKEKKNKIKNMPTDDVYQALPDYHPRLKDVFARQYKLIYFSSRGSSHSRFHSSDNSSDPHQ